MYKQYFVVVAEMISVLVAGTFNVLLLTAHRVGSRRPAELLQAGELPKPGKSHHLSALGANCADTKDAKRGKSRARSAAALPMATLASMGPYTFRERRPVLKCGYRLIDISRECSYAVCR